MSINLEEKIDYISKCATNQKRRWLSPYDLEEEYGFSKSTQAKMRMASNSLKIPFSKIGSKYIRYDRLSIDKWLKEHEVVGA